MKGVLPWLVRWALRAGTRALPALVGQVQKIFFLTVRYLKSFVPIAQQAGQAVVSGRLSLNVCLWLEIKKQAIVVQKIPLVFSIGLCVCKLCCGNMKRIHRRPTESYGAAPLKKKNITTRINNKSATRFANLPLLKGHGSKTYFWIFAMSSLSALQI